jgi:phage replication-related protein YjqB (UPF0714/DUF867 family)
MPCRDFSELVLRCVKGVDYEVIVVDRSADVTISAIHGGSIEPLTEALARAIAGEQHNLYALQGLDPSASQELRVPAGRFDDMRLKTLLKRSQVAISIDGVASQEQVIHLGGKNRRLKRLIETQLGAVGLVVRGPSGPGAAHDPTLFYNLAGEGGVQLELTSALRAGMTPTPLDSQTNMDANGNVRFQACVAAIREAIEQYRRDMRGDLEVALRRFEEATRNIPASLRRGHSHNGHE